MPINKKHRATYLLLSELQSLDNWCTVVEKIMPSFGIYLVGSVLETADYRDVDVRMIMRHTDFRKEFPDDTLKTKLPSNKLKYLNHAISLWGQKATGLPIDFQFQSIKDKQNSNGLRRPLGEQTSE